MWTLSNIIGAIPGVGTAVGTALLTAAGAIALGIVLTATAGSAALAFTAEGGFPTVGQMFIAREAGPELVGTIGSHSAVVNNNQIVESVSAGVYRAVREAMGVRNSGSNPLEVNLYLDGKQITTAVERVQKERGLSLMGSNAIYAS